MFKVSEHSSPPSGFVFGHECTVYCQWNECLTVSNAALKSMNVMSAVFYSLIIILIAHFRMHMLSLVKISSLEYADDAGLLDGNIQEPSTRVTKIATGSRNDAVMFHPNFEILVSYCSYWTQCP